LLSESETLIKSESEIIRIFLLKFIIIYRRVRIRTKKKNMKIKIVLLKLILYNES